MIMTKEHKEAREWEYIRGRKDAISEFKEKLKEEIIYLLKCEEGIVEKFDKLLEKTAQEITK